MVKLKIDNYDVEVPAGTSILDAARKFRPVPLFWMRLARCRLKFRLCVNILMLTRVPVAVCVLFVSTGELCALVVRR